jgi:tetratricopeptide (TPR) repeat protein
MTWGLRLTTAAALVLASWCVAFPASAALTGGSQLAAVYDTILNARFDQVNAQLKRACPPAPAEACQSLAAASLWWQVLLHPESRALDKQLSSTAASAIAANEAWTRREPHRAEAWFYLAGSYGPLVQWRVLRGDHLAAARDAKKIKDALERSLELDPTLGDAYFGIGLYHYYADVAPAAVKILRWLFLLPGGDRATGLREMLRARETGELLKGEADYQLQVVDLWYEHKPMEALELLAGLDARYPANPLFRQRIAEIRDYLHDPASSADAWRELLRRARAGSVYAPQMTEVRARLGLASQLSAMNRTSDAIEQLKIVVDMHPTSPVGANAQAESQLGAALARNPKK